MAEYIDREAALNAQNKSMNLAECRKRLERLPAADVVPVVRCKDCKHLCVRSGALGVYKCAIHGDYPSGEYYCADGNRKDRKDGDGE